MGIDWGIHGDFGVNFNLLFDGIEDCLFILDEEGNVIRANKAAASRLGYTSEELCATNIFLLHPPDRRQETVEIFKSMIAGNSVKCPIPLYSKSGHLIPVESRVFRGTIEEKTVLFAISKDLSEISIANEKFAISFRDNPENNITDKRKSEKAALESKAQLTAILDNLPFLAWLKDYQGRFIAVNRTFAESCGKPIDEIIGKTDYDVWSKELAAKYIADDAEVLSNRKKFVEEMIEDKKGGNWFETYKTPIFDNNGNAVGTTGIARDITERQQLQIELENQKKAAETANVLKSQFLANMSHEIRTPMNGILGFLDLLNQSNLSSEQREYVKEARSASEILLYLINDILDLSKIEANKLTMEKINFNIRTTVEDAVSMHLPVIHQKHLEFNTLIKPNVPDEVIGDPARLRQVLNNLLSNAIKFTESGEIRITVETLERKEDITCIRFEVKDTGLGIKEEDARRVFEPFSQADASTTRKFGGTGLGLAISQKIIKMMDGDIGLDSIWGQGSTIYFTAKFEVVNEKPIKRSEYYKLGNVNELKENDVVIKPKILLVEDNEINIKLIVKVLIKKDFSCDIAGDGSTGFKAYLEKDYDIIFMDCQMPVMDGYECTAKIREVEGNSKHTTIIAMTANAMEGDRGKCLEAGMDDYISKPINFELMFNMIKQYTSSKIS